MRWTVGVNAPPVAMGRSTGGGRWRYPGPQPSFGSTDSLRQTPTPRRSQREGMKIPQFRTLASPITASIPPHYASRPKSRQRAPTNERKAVYST